MPRRPARRTRRTAARLLPLLVLSACAGPPPRAMLGSDREVSLCGQGPTERVQLQYLGVGGVLLRHGGAAIATAPLVSHPSLLRVALGLHIESDRDRLLRLLPPMGDVRAILVGHGHYDHLLDVPTVARELAPNAIVYGNETVGHLLAPLLPEARRVVIREADVASWKRPGRWIPVPGTHFRFMALRSEHAPQVGSLSLFRGRLARDAERVPDDAYAFRGGRTLAFLIDVLREDGSVLLRLFYQDAASSPPAGFPPPPRLLDPVPVDVALLTVGAYASADDYPEAIVLRLAPRHVVLIHWEDFFVSPEDGPRSLRRTDLGEFVRRLERVLPADAGWTLPRPGVSLALDVCR